MKNGDETFRRKVQLSTLVKNYCKLCTSCINCPFCPQCQPKIINQFCILCSTCVECTGNVNDPSFDDFD